jgi:hypothetical protein
VPAARLPWEALPACICICVPSMAVVPNSAAPADTCEPQDFGARDPTAGELGSNFGDKVLGNYNTEHIIKWVKGPGRDAVWELTAQEGHRACLKGDRHWRPACGLRAAAGCSLLGCGCQPPMPSPACPCVQAA